MNCPHCNAQTGPGDAFCSTCGASLAAPPVPAGGTPTDHALHQARLFTTVSYAIQGLILAAGLALIPLAIWWGVYVDDFGELQIQWDEVWIGILGAAVAAVALFVILRIAKVRKAINGGDAASAHALLGPLWIALPLVSLLPGLVTSILLYLARRNLQSYPSNLFAWPTFVPEPMRKPAVAMAAGAGILIIVVAGAILAGSGIRGEPLEWYEERAVGTWGSYHSPDDSYSWLVLKPDRTGCHISTWTTGDDNWDIHHWRLAEPTEGGSRYALYYNGHTRVTFGTFDLDDNLMRRGGSTVYNPVDTARSCP